MGFMGMGWQEIAIIVIIGIIIFGPDKLPEMAGQAGKLLRDFRRMTTEMSGEFEKQTGVSVQELKRNVDREIAGFKSEVAGTTASVKSTVNKTATSVGKTVSTATSKTSSATKTATNAKSTATTASKTSTSSGGGKTSTTAAKTAAAAPVKASKADPLADVSILENTGSAPVNGGPKAAGASAGSAASLVGAGASRGTSDPSADRADAIARARLRRQSAGYQINPPSPN